MKILHIALVLAIMYALAFDVDKYAAASRSYAYAGSFDSTTDALFPYDRLREQPVFKDENVSKWPDVAYTPHMSLMVPGVKKVPEY